MSCSSTLLTQEFAADLKRSGKPVRQNALVKCCHEFYRRLLHKLQKVKDLST